MTMKVKFKLCKSYQPLCIYSKSDELYLLEMGSSTSFVSTTCSKLDSTVYNSNCLFHKVNFGLLAVLPEGERS
jgi:hypothetical protein